MLTGGLDHQLVSPSDLLVQMLAQTVSSLAQTQFELRRMADQVCQRDISPVLA
jgi:hypothetical protein